MAKSMFIDNSSSPAISNRYSLGILCKIYFPNACRSSNEGFIRRSNLLRKRLLAKNILNFRSVCREDDFTWSAYHSNLAWERKFRSSNELSWIKATHVKRALLMLGMKHDWNSTWSIYSTTTRVVHDLMKLGGLFKTISMHRVFSLLVVWHYSEFKMPCRCPQCQKNPLMNPEVEQH